MAVADENSHTYKKKIDSTLQQSVFYKLSFLFVPGSPKTAQDMRSNACVNLFLAQEKYVRNFTHFCCESELCCDFAFFAVILMAFYLVNFYIYFKGGTNQINYIFLASTDV